MEWIMLVVLVSVTIVPVVLLFGFAGCGPLIGVKDISIEDKPPPPPPPPPPAPTPQVVTPFNAPRGAATGSVALAGSCLVQVIPNPNSLGMLTVRKITVMVLAAGPAVTIASATVSLQVLNPPAGGEFWDSEPGTIRPIVTTGVPAPPGVGTPISAAFDLAPLTVPPGRNVLIAFNITTGSGTIFGAEPTPVPGTEPPLHFIKTSAPLTEATTADRTPPYANFGGYALVSGVTFSVDVPPP